MNRTAAALNAARQLLGQLDEVESYGTVAGFKDLYGNLLDLIGTQLRHGSGLRTGMAIVGPRSFQASAGCVPYIGAKQRSRNEAANRYGWRALFTCSVRARLGRRISPVVGEAAMAKRRQTFERAARKRKAAQRAKAAGKRPQTAQGAGPARSSASSRKQQASDS